MLPDRDHRLAFAPHGVLAGREVPRGPLVRPQHGELGLPRFLSRLPHHPGLRRVQEDLAPVLQFPGPQRLALLVHPPPERKRLRRPDLDLNVVGHGVDAGDLVLRAPADQGLIALQPRQRLRPVDPGAQERGDRRRVAGRGEVQQGGLGSGVGVVLLLVLALSAGPDDPPVFIVLEVDLALAAGERAGGELLDQALIMRAQALEHGYERLETRGGDHVGGVLAGLEEDWHDDPGDLRGAVLVEAERAADVLDDLDLGAAGVGEADGLDSAFAGDVDAFSEDAAAGEEGAVDPAPGRVDAACELPDDLAPLGDEVVAAQPRRPDAVRWGVAAGLEFVELRVDGGLRQLVGGGQVVVRGVVEVQLGSGLGQLLRERGGLLDLLVERHDGLEVSLRGVLQERGLQQGQAPAAPRLLRLPENGRGVADLQHVREGVCTLIGVTPELEAAVDD